MLPSASLSHHALPHSSVVKPPLYPPPTHVCPKSHPVHSAPLCSAFPPPHPLPCGLPIPLPFATFPLPPQIARNMSHDELKHLISYIHAGDVDAKGRVSFQDVLRAARAVDLTTPRGRHDRGFKPGTLSLHSGAAAGGVPSSAAAGAASGGVGPRGRTAPSRRTPPLVTPRDDFDPWVLEAYTGAGRGNEYLFDPESAVLYTRPKGGAEYPSPVGRLEQEGASTRPVLFTREELDAFQFFRVSCA